MSSWFRKLRDLAQVSSLLKDIYKIVGVGLGAVGVGTIWEKFELDLRSPVNWFLLGGFVAVIVIFLSRAVLRSELPPEYEFELRRSRQKLWEMVVVALVGLSPFILAALLVMWFNSD